MTVLEMNRAIKSEEQQAFTERINFLFHRFVDYVVENSAEICAGMLALNGNSYAYRTYAMLKKGKPA